MFRTLATKAIVPVTCAVAGFVVVCCILLYTSMKQDRIEESTLHANDISGVLVRSTRYAMLKDDREMLRNIVANVSLERLVDHVRIFNKQGRIVFSGEPAEVGQMLDETAEGCSVCHAGGRPAETLRDMEQARRFTKENGVSVLAITEPIYNGPECSNADCHYHTPEQVVLGTLDLGLSELSLQRALGNMRRELGGFALMVLVLSVGAVATLLRRSVIAPVQGLSLRVARVLHRPGESAETVPEDELELLECAVESLEKGIRTTSKTA